MEILLKGAKEFGVSLSTKQIERFKLFQEELLAWNENINLTSIKDTNLVQSKHFLESISSYNLIKDIYPDRLSLLDLGSGAGFPGIPLKIIDPNIDLCLVESIKKKANFLTYISSKLSLNDVTIVPDRAEQIAKDTGYRESFDVVISRAVAQLDTLLELALPLVRVGGLFIAHKSTRIESEIMQANKASDLLGGELNSVQEVYIKDILDPSTLVLYKKERKSPKIYPRRSGIPRKNPLA